MTRPVVDVYRLPPLQYLILEVLAARYRLDVKIWPFPSTVARPLRLLEAAGLVNLHSPNANEDAPGWRNPIRAELTAAGRAAILDPQWLPPAERDPDPDQPEDAFAFAKALRDPAVRLQLSHDGFISGSMVIVGRTARGFHPTDRPAFRAWRDRSVPGGWTGEPL